MANGLAQEVRCSHRALRVGRAMIVSAELSREDIIGIFRRIIARVPYPLPYYTPCHLGSQQKPSESKFRVMVPKG